MAKRKRSRKEVRAIAARFAKKYMGVKVKLTPVQSSNVRAAGYDPEKKLLAMSFHAHGKKGPKPLYYYPGVPKHKFTGLMKAESKGKFFNRNIKPKFSFIRIK